MQFKINELLASPAFVPFDMSNNRATLGDNAGKLTWDASTECATDADTPCLLDTEEKREAFRDFVRSSGGWSDEEIAAWSETELYTLFLQWIAGDIREAFGDLPAEEWDWEEYQKDSEAGRVGSSLFKTESGDIYFDISQ